MNAKNTFTRKDINGYFLKNEEKTTGLKMEVVQK